MAKVAVYEHRKRGWVLIACLLLHSVVAAQYVLRIVPVDRDSAFLAHTLNVPAGFKNRTLCENYIHQLPQLLQAKGYPTASVDSIELDSARASVHLYVGQAYRWALLKTSGIDRKLLEGAGWNPNRFDNRALDMGRVKQLQEKMLAWLENNGYPFANIRLDSMMMQNEKITASLKVEKGPLYKIDSIRLYGTAKLSNNFLQRYLDIPNGSIYQKDKLQSISRRLNELPYIQETQPWDLTLLGTGSVLNLYLKPKRSSEINVLVGFLPATGGSGSSKLQVTGEATINLRNALGNGESIGLNWQQLQSKSPRLDLSYIQPYLFNSPFGIRLGFDLYKKDSSYVNINMLAGAQYAVSATQTGSIFLQRLSTNLINVDTVTIKSTHQLPQEADVGSVSLGLTYDLEQTNYRYNPRKGNELSVSASVGTKKIRENPVILKLQDGADSSFNYASLYDTVKLRAYQLKLKITAAHYFPITRTSTLKLGMNGGWFESPTIFRNELFQIGGYKLLRGFDEESIFASGYGVATAEYRYLVGQNSFLFTFLDLGWIQNKSLDESYHNSFLGTGLGMAFETKAGIFNISYAVGKRNDTHLDFRQSKIHLGYVNYF